MGAKLFPWGPNFFSVRMTARPPPNEVSENDYICKQVKLEWQFGSVMKSVAAVIQFSLRRANAASARAVVFMKDFRARSDGKIEEVRPS